MVKFNSLLALGCISLLSFVAAESECTKLNDFAESINEKTLIICEYNETTNKIEEISVFGGEVNQQLIDKFVNISSLKTLTFDKCTVPEDLNLSKLYLSNFVYTKYIKNGHRVKRVQDEPVTKNFMKTLKHVDEIKIEGVTITQNALDELSTLTNLKKINLFNNYYDLNLNYGVLKNAKKLTGLSIDYYGGYLDSDEEDEFDFTSSEKFLETICNVKQLKSLEFTGAYPISKLPDCIGNLTKLEKLHLEYNYITSLPKSIGNLKKLKELVIMFNRLSKFSNDICKLTKLEVLNLESNLIPKIPSCIENLTKLKELYMAENSIESFRSGITNLTNLRVIDLGYNEIPKIPSEISNLKNLKKLSLSSNKISTIPEGIGKLKNLVELNLSQNEITTIPKFLGNLKKLKYLYLDYNKIDDVIPESLNNLTELEYVYFNNNVNIKGKTLTNPNLLTCNYKFKNAEEFEGKIELCISKDSECVPRKYSSSDLDFPSCE